MKSSPEKTERIDIQEFTDAKSVDPMFFKKPYYVEPGKGGKKPYQLLVEALKKTKKVGIATFVLRKSENLALLRSKDGFLILQQLQFPEEIRSTEDLKLSEDTKIKKEELKIAETLIEQYSEEFDPSKYKEKYNNDLLKIIKAKAEGKTPKVRKMKPKKAESSNLLAQLKASLDKGKKKKAG